MFNATTEGKKMSAFEYWYTRTGHWIYENRGEALEAWNRGLA